MPNGVEAQNQSPSAASRSQDSLNSVDTSVQLPPAGVHQTASGPSRRSRVTNPPDSRGTKSIRSAPSNPAGDQVAGFPGNGVPTGAVHSPEEVAAHHRSPLRATDRTDRATPPASSFQVSRTSWAFRSYSTTPMSVHSIMRSPSTTRRWGRLLPSRSASDRSVTDTTSERAPSASRRTRSKVPSV